MMRTAFDFYLGGSILFVNKFCIVLVILKDVWKLKK